MEGAGGAADGVKGSAPSVSLLWENGRHPTCGLAWCRFWVFWGILAGFISWRSSKGKELSFPRMCELCDSRRAGNESRKEQVELEQHLAKVGAAGGAGGLPHGIPCWIPGRFRLCIPGNAFPQFLSFQVDILPLNCHLKLSPAVSGWIILKPFHFSICILSNHGNVLNIAVAIPIPSAIPGVFPTCAKSQIFPFSCPFSWQCPLPSQQSPKSRAACPGIPGWNSKVWDVFWEGKQWD